MPNHVDYITWVIVSLRSIQNVFAMAPVNGLIDPSSCTFSTNDF